MSPVTIQAEISTHVVTFPPPAGFSFLFHPAGRAFGAGMAIPAAPAKVPRQPPESPQERPWGVPRPPSGARGLPRSSPGAPAHILTAFPAMALPTPVARNSVIRSVTNGSTGRAPQALFRDVS